MGKITRRNFLKASGIIGAGAGLTSLNLIPGLTKGSNGKKPNFLIIQSDDQGYNDLSIHGNPYLETPQLDALGKESIRFTQFYLHPVCAPTRAAFLTGRHFLKTGVWGVHGGQDFMNLDETTIAEILQKNGYITGMFGKWHVGKTDGYYPWDRGFDESYFARLYRYFDNNGKYNGETLKTKGSVKKVITDFAIKFMEKNKDKPFFCYVPYLTPHEPWKTSEEYIKKYENIGLSRRLSTLYGMIDEMDENIGRLLDRLKELKLEENTIVIFMSDNGPTPFDRNLGKLTENEQAIRNPSGLKGMKGHLWENGIKSPLFVRWPEKFKPAVVDKLTCIEDLFPTILDFASIKLPENNLPLDGITIRPLLEEESPTWPKRYLFFSKWTPKGKWWDKNGKMAPIPDKSMIKLEEQTIAVRSSRYKLLLNPAYGHGYMMYDEREDPQEKNNIISQKPDIADKLKKKLKDWYTGIINSDRSYTSPVFYVGYKGKIRSEAPAYAPSEVGGNVRNSGLSTKGWEAEVDYIVLDLDVRKAGTYNIELEYSCNKLTGTVVEITIGKTKLEGEIDNRYRKNFGGMDIPKGKTKIKVLVKSINPDFKGKIFDKITKVIFTKKS